MEALIFFFPPPSIFYKVVSSFSVWTTAYCYFLIPLNHYPQENTETLGSASSMQDVLGMSTDFFFACLKLFTEINACM